MNNDRRENLKIALRKSRGRLLVREWSLLLGEACGVEVGANSFLSLEKTGMLRRGFFELVAKNEHAHKHFWHIKDVNMVIYCLHSIARRVNTMPVILFSNVDQFVGAVCISADCILRNSMPVWNVVGDDLCITSDDLGNGLCLEKTCYNASGEYLGTGFYELTVWGAFDAIDEEEGEEKGAS